MLPLPICKLPPSMVISPEPLLFPVRARVPAPLFVKAPEPEMEPLRVCAASLPKDNVPAFVMKPAKLPEPRVAALTMETVAPD